MEVETLIKLVSAVSESNLTGFQYEDKECKLKLSRETEAVLAVPAPAVAAAAEMPQDASGEDSCKVIASPLVGNFYAAPAEDAPPFVSVGDTVQKGQVLAIVEAMKLMNEIESDFDGVIEEICVENGQPVEYKQPLFKIKCE